MAQHRGSKSDPVKDIWPLATGLQEGWGSIEEIKYAGPCQTANQKQGRECCQCHAVPNTLDFDRCHVSSSELSATWNPLIKIKTGMCLACALWGLADLRRSVQICCDLAGERGSNERLSLPTRLRLRCSTHPVLLFWLSVTLGILNSMTAIFAEMTKIQ